MNSKQNDASEAFERSRLPYKVRTDSRKLFSLGTAVRGAFEKSALMRGKSLDMNATVFGWFGYDREEGLLPRESVTDAPCDEECSAKELANRHRMQAEIAASGLGISLDAAVVLIESLRPTSSVPGISQLRRFQKILLDRGIPPYDKETEDGIRDWMVRIGWLNAPEDETLRAVTTDVLRPEGLLLYLEDVFGWRIDRTPPSGDVFLKHLGTSVGTETPSFDIYMTSVIPNQQDRQALLEKVMSLVAASGSAAVLLFNHPSLISLTPDKDILLGGLILANGRWSKFFLHPDLGLGRGIDGAFHQHSAGSDFGLNSLAFDRASFLCQCLTSLAIGETIGKTRFSRIRFNDGFTIFVPPLIGERIGLL
ncbi:hypothetical protein G6L37_34595 [Agrobacterium rubi]|nr:hypothetical protein [Agrobacterium rubi]NTF23697.1 hypothetical protein [Agrobacterium rubi]